MARFEKGDLVAFAGDSITSGGTCHKYILTYWTTRHPELGVRFRNKGIFSDFVHGGIGRLETDILKEKPNKVVIIFGMNDSGASYRKDLFGMSDPNETVLQKRREAVAKYRANMEKLLALLKERGIATVLVGPSIYDNTMKSDTANNLGANSGIQACIEELKTLKNGSGFVDFNAPMLEVNARMQAKDPTFGIAGRDRVHPETEGHWVMAYEFLKAQNASPIVASVKVDESKGAVLENANCSVEALQTAAGKVSFDFLPRSLPLPVNDEYRRGEKVVPITELLNREMLTVQGLAPGRYALRLDGQNAGEFTAKELAAGVNIATLEANPGQRRAKAVDALIQERASQESRIRQLRQFEAGMKGKKSRGEIDAELSHQIDEAKAQDDKKRLHRLHKLQEDFPQEAAIDQSILDLEQQIFAAAKPEKINVSIELAPTMPSQAAEPLPKSRFVQNLKAGRKQTLVAYGTSLSAIGAWVDQLRVVADQQFPGLSTVINGAQGGANSDWGREKLEEKVLSQKPDTVLLEFSVNDAVGGDKAVAHTRANLEHLIDRILQANPECEIILQVMNPPVGHTKTDRPNLAAHNQVYRDVAKERGLRLIDHHPAWMALMEKDPVRFMLLTPDLIHPARNGSLEISTPVVFAGLGLAPGNPSASTEDPCWKYLRHLMNADKDPLATRAEFDAFWTMHFKKSDTNGDGILSAGEFHSEELARGLDKNHDGKLELPEYVATFVPLFEPASIAPVPRTEQEEKWVSNHEARVAAAKKGDIDVILIGDSITHYSAGNKPYKHHFGARKALNLGQGGDRTQNVLWRLQHGEVDGIQPKVAMLMIGTNNLGRGESPENTVLGIKAILAELQQRLPNTKVVLCSIFPRDGAIMASVDKVNAELPALADGQQVIHADLKDVFLNPDGSLNASLYHTDKLHLSAEGYRAWFGKTESLIAAALGETPLPPTSPK